MKKGNGSKTKSSNDSGLNFEAQLTSEWFIKDEPQRAEALGDMNVAAGAPVSDPARFKVAVTNTPDRRSALRFTEGCRCPQIPPEARWHSINSHFSIPTGLHPSAQGCRVREATLGNVFHHFPQPQRGCINRSRARGCNPFRVVELLGRFPRVARSSQPWAERHSPVGAKQCRADLHPDLKADFVPVRKDLVTGTRVSAKTILAEPNRRSVGETELHPPFNMSDWGGEILRQGAGFFSLSASNGFLRSREREKVAQPDEGRVERAIQWERAGVRCRNSRMNHRGISSVRGQWRPCASTTTWKLARMNLAIRGIDANLGPRNADSMMSSKLVSNLVGKVETTVSIHHRN